MDTQLLNFHFPDLPKVHCAFHKRSFSGAFNELAGNFSFKMSDEWENVAKLRRDLFAILAKKGLKGWAECRQTHGVNVLDNPAETSLLANPDFLPEADGLWTDQTGFGLVIKTADCQPLLITDKSGKQIMALHIGWRGNRANFIEKAVRKFCLRYGLEPKKLLAVRGPSLGPANARFTDFANEWGEEFAHWYDKKTQCMNLWLLTRDQLIAAGLTKENISGVDICTREHSDEYFSYRANKNTGRQAAIIWIEK